MDKNKRVVGVLFSGGLDSTYLVWKNLKDGNIVQPIYIEIENNGNKTKLEKNRIELLFNEFSEEFSLDLIKSIKYPLIVSVNGGFNSMLLKQVPIWIMGLLTSQNNSHHYNDITELQISYVSGDDAMSYLSEINSIYKAYNKMSAHPLVPLKFPMSKTSKYEITNELPQNYLDLIVSCEEPKNLNDKSEIYDYDPCGYCAACKKIINYEGFGDGLSKKYRKIVVDNAFKVLRNSDSEKWETEYDEEKLLEKHIYTVELPTEQKHVEPVQLKLDFTYTEIDSCESLISDSEDLLMKAAHE
jgi:hypothetical protein